MKRDTMPDGRGRKAQQKEDCYTMSKEDEIFQRRLEKHHDELKWLYMELYDNDSMFAELCTNLYRFHKERKRQLKARDKEREKNPQWFRKNDMLGMMLYIDQFAGNLKGVKEKLSYLEDCQVNCLHLMPFLDSPKAHSDGGYAVADFRKVRTDLGTMEDLAALADVCHQKGMNLCMDFVMNHTSEEHEWAVRARQGEGEYMSRYFFYDNQDIPNRYEQTVPQVFPTTAPGNFTFLPEIGHYVMTTFYPYQWDLNYGNPRVFNEMMYNFLFFANQGMDIIRIDAVPYIWKELGTSCRNLPQVHSIVRMMRMIGEIVCPSVLLLGEVVMEPEKVVPYFGTVEKPECHMLYNVTTMASTWNCVATKDVRLLKRQMDAVSSLPSAYTFLNYLRCHDDIGWGLDYAFLSQWEMWEAPHKRFLNEYFTGRVQGSVSRGELYNDDPVTQDARFCGTTASMCGIESAQEAGDADALQAAIDLDVMLHAYMLTQSGIPMLYSGDEIGQINDYSYKEDPDKAPDSRYLHRGRFRWELAEKRNEEQSVQGRIFGTLHEMEEIRGQEQVFEASADVYTYDVHNNAILCIVREQAGERFFGIFNFADRTETAWMQEEGQYTDLLTREKRALADIVLPPHGFYWLKKEN